MLQPLRPRLSREYHVAMRDIGHKVDLNDLAVLSGDTACYRLSQSNEDSLRAAQAMTRVFGPRVPIIERYLDALSFAPRAHLEILIRRDAEIVFAPTIDVALTSDWAERRRGQALTMAEARALRIDYGPESNAVGIYDPDTDALIFPTGYCTRDLQHVVLHELGHALTMPRATFRAQLIKNLPRRLDRHVYSEYYLADSPETTLRHRVFEALAEGYIEIIEGRIEQLPKALASELMFMLQSMEDGPRVRFEFEQTKNGERSASRASDREIIDASDPELGHLFAPLRTGPNAQDWKLDGDQLAMRRRRRLDVA